MARILTVLLALLLFFPCLGSAQDLELGKLVVQLLETHERVQAAQAAVESAEQMTQRAKAGWLPRVNLVVEGGHEEIDKSMTDTATSKFRNEQDLVVTQQVLDFGATDGNIAVYQAMSEEAAARLEQTRQELITRGVQAYLSVIRGREMVKYAKRSEDNIKRLSGMQEALVQRGAGLSYEDLQIKAQLAGAQALLVNMQRSLDTAMNSFRAVYGFELDEAQVGALGMPQMPLPLIPGTLEECVDIARKENPALMELMHTVARTSGQAKAVDASFYPDIELVGEYNRKEQDQGAQGIRYETRGGLQLNYTLFNGGGDTAASRSAQADLVAARKSVLDRERSIEEAVRNAWLDLKTLHKNVELYENQANITWEFLSLVKKKKAMGAEVGLLDILVGERDYISAISSKVGAEIDYNIAAYSLLYQMGRMDLDAVGI